MKPVDGVMVVRLSDTSVWFRRLVPCLQTCFGSVFGLVLMIFNEGVPLSVKTILRKALYLF